MKPQEKKLSWRNDDIVLLTDEEIRTVLRRLRPESGPALSMVMMDMLSRIYNDDTQWVKDAAEKLARSGEQLAEYNFELGFIYLVEACVERPNAYLKLASCVYRAAALISEYEFYEGHARDISKNIFRSLIHNGNVNVRVMLREIAHAASLLPDQADQTRMWYDAIERRPSNVKELAQLRGLGWNPEVHEAAYLLDRELTRSRADPAAYGPPGNNEETAAYTAAVLHLQQIASVTIHRPAVTLGL